MVRHDGRRAGELRRVELVPNFTKFADGSMLIKTGQTHVLCTASFVEGVPKFREGTGLGWLTAEYDMLPASTGQRRQRSRNKVDGRAQEIQRLIGRSLRAVSDLADLGENTIYIDCDVLQADGGTRTASITGAYSALCLALKRLRKADRIPGRVVRKGIAAVSVGKVEGRVLLDLDYVEDSSAEVDCNVVMTSRGEFVEVQSTGEEATFSRAELDRMLALAAGGIRKLLAMQKQALAKA
ncbi:MAG: ribonuclease PH [Phycisphaerae bacterium]|nr:ribonuclease PH [Phycisphaerae bacterium]